jgi:hypothetical protein
MDGQAVMQGVVLVRAVVDAVRSLWALRPSRRPPGVIPIYRLIPRDQLLSTPADRATDVTKMRWPR